MNALSLRLLVVALVATFVPALSLGTASSAHAATTTDYVARANAATNDARSAHRIRPLRGNACLQRAARRQAERMALLNEIGHSPDFGSIGGRCGLSTWGENVAQALGGDQGRGVVRQWMRSRGHRDNILNRRYRVVGMGAVKAHGSWWVVQVFGRRR